MLKIILFCSLFLVSNGQSRLSITQPKLTSLIPLNSTAFTVNWQFASESVDQSNLTMISIAIYEFYLTHNTMYGPFNYTYPPQNRTLNRLTFNSEWVNAYYYVCFSSNSTNTGTSQYVAVQNECMLTRTCSRSNTSCTGPPSVQLVSTDITATSFIVAFLWPIDLPYNRLGHTAQLMNNGPSGTPLPVIQNSSFNIVRLQFNNLQSSTTYLVNTSFTYNILNSTAQTNTSLITVQTSIGSRNVVLNDQIFFFIFYPVISFLFSQIK